MLRQEPEKTRFSPTGSLQLLVMSTSTAVKRHFHLSVIKMMQKLTLLKGFKMCRLKL